MTRRGLLIILSSPSGAWKSTLAKRLLQWDNNIQFSVSATTRAPRVGEEHGRDYYFHTCDEFETMVAQGDMLEHAEVFGNLYGSPRGPVEGAINQGQIYCLTWIGRAVSKSAIRPWVSMFCRSLFCHR